MARNPKPVATRATVQLLGVHHGCGNLEVVPGHAFMEDGGGLLPRCEGVFTFGYRPPHPPGDV